MKATRRLAACLILLFSASGYAEDFSLSRDGVGPISVHTILIYQGKGEHLSARAVNDSGKAIPYVKLCVTAETKGCLFTLWNTSTWEAGAELNWDMDSTRKVRNLSHQVSIAEDEPAPARPDHPPTAPDVLTRGIDACKYLLVNDFSNDPYGIAMELRTEARAHGFVHCCPARNRTE
jgi:hypothetical protein